MTRRETATESAGAKASRQPETFRADRRSGAAGSGARIRACLLLVLLVLFHAAAAADAGADVPGADLDVSLFTFGPGEEVWERFGHNAIEVRDRASGRALLYNYGIFDFAQKNFFLNFARGLMTYRIAAGDPADELPVYVEEGRWIVEQKLNLTAPQKARLAAFLAWNARPENALYRYDYFSANCSTRVRDALDMAVGGQIKAQTIAPSRGFTYRMDADRLMRPDPLVMLAMDAGLGPFADQRLSYWAEGFVPMELMRRLREVRISDAAGNSVPLVAAETKLAPARLAEPPDFPPDWLWPALGIGLGGAAAIAALDRLRRRVAARALLATFAAVVELLLGVGGIVLLGLWLLTDHVSAWGNENLLLFNPLCLLLVPAWLASFGARWQPGAFARRVGAAIALAAGVAFFVKVFPAFRQDNRLWIAVLLPWHAAFAWVLVRRSPVL
jgi:hypothetical protein